MNQKHQCCAYIESRQMTNLPQYHIALLPHVSTYHHEAARLQIRHPSYACKQSQTHTSTSARLHPSLHCSKAPTTREQIATMAVPSEVLTLAGRIATFHTAHQVPKRRASSSRKKTTGSTSWPHASPLPEDARYSTPYDSNLSLTHF